MTEERKKYTMSDFDEYFRQGEPDKREKAQNWRTAIGLQAVDGLTVSDYLIDTARRHIEGEITIEQVKEMVKSYYQSKKSHEPNDDGMQEADRVASNIANILSTRTLAFNANGYISLHRQIFDGVFKFAGRLRDYDITKNEWVLRGDTVSYLNHEDLRMALDYDINQERDFDYSGMDMQAVIKHIARFVSGLWQIHAFGEGNTRTTAVFTIQYLRSIGFDVDNDMFSEHSWYFRNALVRSNYKNVQQNIMYDFTFLERFFENLLLGKHNELRNRYMLINPPEEWKHSDEADRTSTEQVPNKYRTSTEQALLVDPNILSLIKAIGNDCLSVKGMLQALDMKHRPTFLENYLNPAIEQGLVRMLYPQSPKSPRQKYLLTVKGLVLASSLNNKN